MIELLRARLELLSVEIETVSLLGRTAPSDSPHRTAATERQIELKQEMSLLQAKLGEVWREISPGGDL
jgi:hypothetical protein